MGNTFSTKQRKALPIDTTFKLPSPIPTWPPGEGFASGTIDLGGLKVQQVTSFNKIWATHKGGPGDIGATFFEPSPIPDGFSMLGCYSQPNNQPLFGWVLVGKDDTADPSTETLKNPVDYTLLWSSESSKITKDGEGYVWLPTPPDGYKAVGHVVTTSPTKPPLDKIRCVRSDLTDQCKTDKWIWGEDNEFNSNKFNVFKLKPSSIGKQSRGVSVGTFLAQKSGSTNTPIDIVCLKNNKFDSSTMPSLTQIEALLEAYSPLIYFHPKEKFLPSSVSGYFNNGVQLHKKGDESSKPEPIDPTGSNLPQGGSNDGAYWLDLPTDDTAKERVKKGDLRSSEAYIHIKSMLGATFSDLAIWVFYPFNGPATARLGLIDIPLGKIGEHVGDWEHVTLRVSNFNGVLYSVYFSQHSKGSWVDSPSLEFEKGNKAVAYTSLNGHALYAKQGLVLQGGGGVGLKNESEKSEMVMDIGKRNKIVAYDNVVVEPPWLNYTRKWGPEITYKVGVELEKVEKLLPGNLKSAFQSVVNVLPDEVLGEEGPTGPKMKRSWDGDEA